MEQRELDKWRRLGGMLRPDGVPKLLGREESLEAAARPGSPTDST